MQNPAYLPVTFRAAGAPADMAAEVFLALSVPPGDAHHALRVRLPLDEAERAALALLNEEKEQAATIQEGIVEQISELPLSVSFVKQEETLIRTAQTSRYWSKADENAYDELVIKLGPLMKFREQPTGEGQTHLDLVDELHKKEWVEFGPQHEAVNIARYREMVETLIAELMEHNPVLKKIKNGETVTADEAEQLAELLHEEHPHITEDLLRQVYKNRKARFIQFIRHILGIEALNPDFSQNRANLA